MIYLLKSNVNKVELGGSTCMNFTLLNQVFF